MGEYTLGRVTGGIEDNASQFFKPAEDLPMKS